MLVVNSLNVDCKFQLLSCCMNRPQNHGVKMMKLLEKKKNERKFGLKKELSCMTLCIKMNSCK